MERKERTHLVAMAALLHDVGKVGQRSGLDGPDDATIEAFCPHDPSTSRRSHLHAAWTGKFVEECCEPLWRGQGPNSLMILASRHHAASTPLDWAVTEADRLSSGMDRPEAEDLSVVNVSDVPLDSVLSRVSIAENPRKGTPLHIGEFSPTRKMIFPTDVPEVGSHCYEALWNGLRKDAQALAALAYNQDLSLVFHAALHLLERYGSNVPASTVTQLRDISLYDHARSASAIAACIAYSAKSEEDESFVRDRSAKRFALVCADISGIQSYIHALKSEGARRSLTGRSFYVQLLQDAIATAVVSRYDLPPSCVIYQGGGHVWFFLPSEVLESLETYLDRVDLELWLQTGGLLGVSLGYVSLSGEDLINKRVGAAWKRALDKLHERRLRRMSSLNYNEVFQVQVFKKYDCQQCERETDSEARQCSHCRMTEEIGRLLGRTKVIYRLDHSPGFDIRGFFVVETTPSLGIRYLFRKDIEQEAPSGIVCLALKWPTSEEVALDAKAGRARIFWPIATSEPVEFERLAERNPGVPRLGVLRGDMDNLGSVFERGLPQTEQSLSRLAALSRSLNIFFGAYVPDQIRAKWPDDVRIVFSGGDDCFLIGSFHAIPEVAKWLRDELCDYGAKNPSIGLSAGIAIQDGNAPIIATARWAAQEEAAAKNFTRQGRRKDAVALFGEPLSWPELQLAGGIVACLVLGVRGLSSKDAGLSLFGGSHIPGVPKLSLPRSILQTLSHVAALRVGGRSKTLRHVMNSHRWMWIAHYSLVRAAKASPQAKAFLDWLLDQILNISAPANKDLRPLIEVLSVVAAWSFLITRPR